MTIYRTDKPIIINGKKWTFRSYQKNVKKEGRCPCGYFIHDELALGTHYGEHVREQTRTA